MTPNQTYQLSFWIRDFGSNSIQYRNLYVYFHDQSHDLKSSYTESRIPSPYRADFSGNALPHDPEDSTAVWTQHIFTFNSTDGNGIVSLGHWDSWYPFDGTLRTHTIYLDNFSLTMVPVPEPAGVLLLGLAFLGVVGRRQRGTLDGEKAE